MLVLSLFQSYAQKSTNENDNSGIKIISSVDVNELIDGKPGRATTVELTILPLEESQPHRHPGPVYGYVLRGSYQFKVEGQPLITLREGITFYESKMAFHEVGHNPDSNFIAKVLAKVVHPRDAKQLVILEEPNNR